MSNDRPSSRRIKLYDTDLPIKQAVVAVASLDRRRQPGELSAIEERFCRFYTAHYEATRAVIEAGYRPSSSTATARRLLTNSLVKKRIAMIEADRMRRLRFDGDVFVAREMLLATADVAELVETWIPPCRYCWGENNQYQRTHAEFTEDFESWCRLPEQRRGNDRNIIVGGVKVLVYNTDGGKIPFDQQGGDGYDPSQPPNPNCPNCRGRGNEDPELGTIPYIRFKDTRELSDTGRLLYAGIERGPKGIKLLTQNQDAARARLMGMLSRFLELRSNNASGPPTLDLKIGMAAEVADLFTDDPSSMSDQQLDDVLAKYGIVLNGTEGETEASGSDSGEGPPPGRIA